MALWLQSLLRLDLGPGVSLQEPQVTLLPAEVEAIRDFDRSFTRNGSFVMVSEDTFKRLIETCLALFAERMSEPK